MWMEALSVAVGGAAGSLARWGVSTGIARTIGTEFPWATLAVNGAGCLIFGWAAGLVELGHPEIVRARMFLLTGFLGAFTTFSTYAFETISLARGGAWFSCAANLVLQNASGLALILAGMWLARRMV